MRKRAADKWGCWFLAFALLCGSAWAEESRQKFKITASLEQLYGTEQAEKFSQFLDPESEISWQVYLPDNPGDEPPGLLVYVSPTRSGAMDGRWAKVLDQRNLIYIAANRSGNKVPVTRRMVLATSSILAISRQMEINEDRIFISGFSGGGRVASFLSNQYPAVFSGAIFICGVNFWNEDVINDMDRVLNNRYAFVSGTRDFNLSETRIVYNKYLKAGASNSLLEIENGMAHALPNAKTLEAALSFLENE